MRCVRESRTRAIRGAAQRRHRPAGALTLDERNGTVLATDYAASFDWSAGRGGADLEWKSSLGIVFFQYEQQRVFGLQLDEQGRFTLNLDEMKSQLITAVNRAGWNWRPSVWQGPVWLRWLTE